MDKISICIPAYNARLFIGETLESVRKQTYKEWELILVEDGSSDGTEQIVSKFASNTENAVHYIRHERNLGLTRTRNTGILNASSEWIAILDADDLWTPDHLESCMKSALQSDAELIHAGSILFDSDTGEELSLRAPSSAILKDPIYQLFLGNYVIQPSSVLMKKALWERVEGFNPEYHHCEDREMWLRCIRSNAPIKYTGDNTCLYRKHSKAMSTQAYKMAEANARVYDQHLDWKAIPLKKRKALAAEAHGAAGRIIRTVNTSKARRHFARAFMRSKSAKWLAYYCLTLGR